MDLAGFKSLNLSFSMLTDVGLKHIARFSKLEELTVEGTNIIDEGVVELKRSNPKIKIRR